MRQQQQQIISNDRVRLIQELTELQLRQGEVGVVRSSWHFPNVAYEVEFQVSKERIRVLLLDHQVAPERFDEADIFGRQERQGSCHAASSTHA